MQNQSMAVICPKCTAQNPNYNRYCGQCGNGLVGIPNESNNNKLHIYTICIAFFSIVEGIYWLVFNRLFDYRGGAFLVFSRSFGFITSLIWYSFPLVYGILLPKSSKVKTPLIIVGAIFCVIRIGYYILTQFYKDANYLLFNF
jgi:hypothetical protein